MKATSQTTLALIAACGVALAAADAKAQFVIAWLTVDGGTSTGGTFAVSGTIG